LDLGAAGRDNAFGYGLVQAYDAIQSLGGGTPADNPPSVTMTNPSDGATVSGTVAITATATDDNGVTQVEFFVNGTSIGVDTSGESWSASWDTTAYANGSYTLSATATDTAGKTGSDSVTVTVDNSGGTTYPIDLTAVAYKVKGAGAVDLSWTDSTSTDVDVYRNGGLLVTIPDVGSYTDNDLGKGGGSATYQVCEAGSTTICSNEVTVIW